jgi:hypothetical protein
VLQGQLGQKALLGLLEILVLLERMEPQVHKAFRDCKEFRALLAQLVLREALVLLDLLVLLVLLVHRDPQVQQVLMPLLLLA